MDNVLAGGANPRYWAASGAYFAYLFARVAALPNTTVDQVGHSQLMDAPGQEPSVTLLDWTTGQGTAAYWATWLVIRAFSMGDTLVSSSSSNASLVHVQAYLHTTAAPARPDLPGASDAAHAMSRVLLVNRVNGWSTVNVPPGSFLQCAVWQVTDATSSAPQRAACADIDDDASGGWSLTLPPFATAVLELTA
jgi:hypothetical protein